MIHICGKLVIEDGIQYEVTPEIGGESWIAINYPHKRHRVKGPVWKSYNLEEWHLEGRPHRLDGPALTWNHYSEWWFHGKKILVFSQQDFEKHLRTLVFA